MLSISDVTLYSAYGKWKAFILCFSHTLTIPQSALQWLLSFMLSTKEETRDVCPIFFHFAWWSRLKVKKGPLQSTGLGWGQEVTIWQFAEDALLFESLQSTVVCACEQQQQPNVAFFFFSITCKCSGHDPGIQGPLEQDWKEMCVNVNCSTCNVNQCEFWDTAAVVGQQLRVSEAERGGMRSCYVYLWLEPFSLMWPN